MTGTAAEDLRFRCLDRVVPAEWMDRNGHMNMQHYFGLVDLGLEELAEKLGLGTGRLEIRQAGIQYRKELFAGQAVELFVRPTERKGNEITLAFEILRTGAEPVLSAECEVTGVLTDPATGAVASIPDAAAREFDRCLYPSKPKLEVAPVFELPFREDHWFESARGVVPDHVHNEAGVVGLQGHVWLFERGGMGMFAELNRAETVFVPGQVGGFALSSRMRLLRRILPGEPFSVRSRVHALGRKTASFRHELFTGGSSDTPSATSDHTMIFIDMTRRKSRPVPEKFLEILERRHGIQIPRG